MRGWRKRALAKGESMNQEKMNNGGDKVSAYKWTMKDEPGEFRLIHKSNLQIPAEYQRIETVSHNKVLTIVDDWSWIALGVLIVAERDNVLWVVDGQHRKLAADKRSDVQDLPCMVFQTDSIAREAQGFLDVNTGRKPLSSLARFKAQVASGDEDAIFVNGLLRRLGLVTAQTANAPKTIKCVGVVMTLAKANRQSTERVMELVAELCKDCFVHEILILGLAYINDNCEFDLTDGRLVTRIKSVGSNDLVLSAKKAAAYFASGGAKVYGEAMLDAINKNLRTRFLMKGRK